jgi:WD repeat-containing protein 68
VGSFQESEVNHIQLVDLNEDSKRFEVVSEIEHVFPSPKLMFRPPGTDGSDLLASVSTTLNLMTVADGKLKLQAKLQNTRTLGPGKEGHAPPLTSFDWSSVDQNKIGVSSVDSTCTIWNIEKQKIETQLIAHDKAVHDMVFHTHSFLFASVGADGSVRLFDQRNLDHSTIIYENPSSAPLLRLAWNKINTQHLVCTAMDTPGVVLIDIRRPSVALSALTQCGSCVNSIMWAPHSKNHILCGTDDGFGFIWDVQGVPKGKDEVKAEPVHWHDCDQEVFQVQWPSAAPDHVALGMSNHFDIVKI